VFSVGAFAAAPAGSILENMERAVFGSNKFQKRPVFFVGQQNYIIREICLRNTFDLSMKAMP
jgi:hypothetical protein